jgi:uncharacterized OB-fold protein
MGRAITRCPRCGATVSPFAAGCAICGTDLEAARARRRRVPTISLPALSHDARSTAFLVAIVVVLVVFAAPIGILLALYCAWDRNRNGDLRVRDLLLALALLGVVLIVMPSLNPVGLL